MSLKNILIILAVLAVILGGAAVFVVFYNPAISVTPGIALTSSTSLFSLMKGSAASGSTAGAPNAFSGSPSSAGVASSTENQSLAPQFASTYEWPYPLQWTEGQSTLVIAGAAIQGNQLILAIAMHTGNQPECVPMNMRLIIDESGNLEIPTPSQFSFPDTNSCNGTPNTTYDAQTISFTLGQNSQAPFLLTTGGTSNIFFEVATTTGGVSITLPATSG